MWRRENKKRRWDRALLNEWAHARTRFTIRWNEMQKRRKTQINWLQIEVNKEKEKKKQICDSQTITEMLISKIDEKRSRKTWNKNGCTMSVGICVSHMQTESIEHFWQEKRKQTTSGDPKNSWYTQQIHMFAYNVICIDTRRKREKEAKTCALCEFAIFFSRFCSLSINSSSILVAIIVCVQMRTKRWKEWGRSASEWNGRQTNANNREKKTEWWWRKWRL